MNNSSRIDTAVIPCGGLGTRLLPATQYTPKEMMLVYDRPAVELVASEIAEAGFGRIVVITSPTKPAIIQHLEASTEVWSNYGRRVELVEVVQTEPLGLGHAVLCASAVLNDEPFAVVLPDTLIFGDEPEMGRLLSAWDGSGAVISTKHASPDVLEKSGVISGHQVRNGVWKVDGLVEKPRASEAPSDLIIVGRYILPGMTMRVLEEMPGQADRELELTDGLRLLLKSPGVSALEIAGIFFDTGYPAGLIAASAYRSGLVDNN